MCVGSPQLWQFSSVGLVNLNSLPEDAGVKELHPGGISEA